MKKDPYSGLAGLDQRLFLDNSNKGTRKLGNKEATTEAGTEPSLQTPKETTTSPDKAAIQRASNEGERQATPLTSKQRTPEARRTPVSPLRGQKVQPCIVGRHTYDIFQDQVRWMNRLKLDIEEAYNERVTVNGLVTLALDLLREDYELNGEGSNIIRVLVRGRVSNLKASPTGEEEG
jgi:hypothetical protein